MERLRLRVQDIDFARSEILGRDGQGGRSRLTEEDYLEGPPELIVEVAASSVAYDLHDEKRAYQRNGVPEYLTVQMYEQRVDWFVLRAGVYEPLEPGEAGVLRSEVFPGLWLRPAALWSGDLTGLLATLQAGLASPEHAEFVARWQRLAGSGGREKAEGEDRPRLKPAG